MIKEFLYGFVGGTIIFSILYFAAIMPGNEQEQMNAEYQLDVLEGNQN